MYTGKRPLHYKRMVKVIAVFILFLNQIVLIAFIYLQSQETKRLNEKMIEQISLEYSRELARLRAGTQNLEMVNKIDQMSKGSDKS